MKVKYKKKLHEQLDLQQMPRGTFNSGHVDQEITQEVTMNNLGNNIINKEMQMADIK